MRLSDKVMAVVLAAAVSVSMLTACSGGGGGGGNNGSGSSSSSSSSSASSDSTSGGGAGGGSSSSSKPSSGSSSSSASSSSESSSSSSSDSSSSSSASSTPTDPTEPAKGQTVAYAKSRTVAFLKNLSKANKYTIDAQMTVSNVGEADAKNEWILSTNGSRSYFELEGDAIKEGFDNDSITSVIYLVNESLTSPQAWLAVTMEDKDLDNWNVKGVYGEIELTDAQKSDVGRDSLVEMLQPDKGEDFSWEKRGTYYFESQIVNYTEGTKVYTYAYRGEYRVPEYVEIDDVMNGQAVVKRRMEFATMKFEADAELMDFNNVFNNYVNVDDLEGKDSDSLSMARTFKAGTKNAKRAVVG